MDTLTDPLRIRKFLQGLHDQRSLLTIRIGSSDEKFTSAIIGLDANTNRLRLDELKPETGHQRLIDIGACRALGFLNGISVQFTAAIVESGQEEGTRYYVAAIPNTLNYLQRRDNVRVNVSAANPVNATVTADNGSTIQGELKDISLGGLGLRFQKELPESFQADGHVHICFPWPPNPRETFTCDAQIRLVKHRNGPLQPAFIGCEFLSLSKPEQRRIERLVMTLQRLAQKRRNNM